MTEIEQLTRCYWGVSSAFNGRPGPNLTTAEAIHIVGDVLESTGPKRVRLRNVSSKLLDEIIHGARKKKSKTPPDNVLKMARG